MFLTSIKARLLRKFIDSIDIAIMHEIQLIVENVYPDADAIQCGDLVDSV